MRVTRVTVLVVLLLAIESAWACSCARQTGREDEQVAEAYEAAAVVVLGRVQSVSVEARATLWSAGPSDYQRARIVVVRHFKGPFRAGAGFGILTSMEYTMCGRPVSVGQELLIYGAGAEPYLLDSCGRTRSLKFATLDLEVLERLPERRPGQSALEFVRALPESERIDRPSAAR